MIPRTWTDRLPDALVAWVTFAVILVIVILRRERR